MDNIFFDLKRLKYLGKGSIIGKTVRIRKPEEAIIGDYSIIDDFTYISCAIEIGSYCHIATHVSLSGNKGKILIGDCSGIAAGCKIHSATSDFLNASTNIPSIPDVAQFGGRVEDVVIEKYVLLGANTVVLPGVHLPNGFACTPNTVIRKYDYEPWTLYDGNNCKKITKRRTKELRKKLEEYHKLGLSPPLPPI